MKPFSQSKEEEIVANNSRFMDQRPTKRYKSESESTMAWTDQRYEMYVQERWMPIFEGIEQMSNLHKTTAVKGQFATTFYIVNDGHMGAAFINQTKGQSNSQEAQLGGIRLPMKC